MENNCFVWRAKSTKKTIVPNEYFTQSYSYKVLLPLLDPNFYIHARKFRGWTPLHYAVPDGKLAVVKLLLDCSAQHPTTAPISTISPRVCNALLRRHAAAAVPKLLVALRCAH